MRLAHLTDLHLRVAIPGHSPHPVRRSREAFGLFTRTIEDACQRGADAIVVTGDLLDIPDHLLRIDPEARTDHPLWAAVEHDYRLIEAALDRSGVPWIVLPGNHDCAPLMARIFGEQSVRDIGPLRFVSFGDREHAWHVPRRVLAERKRFDGALVDPSPRLQVHLQHYVITPDLNDDYPHTYLEGEVLQARIVDSGKVALCLSGHYHPGLEPTRIGPTTFSVTPALTQSPHPYRIFEVSDDGSVSSEEIHLDADPEPRPAVFLDRDGCINTLATYHVGPGSMELIPGAAAGLRLLREAGYALVVVTNQSCVGHGYVTPETVAEVNDRMCELLHAEGAGVDAIYATFDGGAAAVHPRWNIGDAKPSPAMLERAARELHLDLSRSVMIGDRRTDLEAARAAGVAPILVRTGDGAMTAGNLPFDVPVYDHVGEAAAAIAARARRA